jgi:NAD(P)-dependent dehydrogenase (short-subunit alcohol dehydrogenase family)
VNATPARFTRRVVLATGAAAGLGLAAARQFASEGARLVLVDWAERPLEDAVAELTDAGAEAVAVVGDVSLVSTAREAVRVALETYGRVDVLFNNAGIDPLEATSLAETEEDVWDKVIDVNLKSAYLFVRECVPIMAAAGGGSIITTASSAGTKASPREAVYGISKAGLIALTRSVARDHAHEGIRANCVCPGFLENIVNDRKASMTEEAVRARSARAAELVPIGREGTYDEIARSILFLASDESTYTTGASLLIDGGWLA